MKADVNKIIAELGETKNFGQAIDIVQNAWPEKDFEDVVTTTKVLLNLGYGYKAD